MLAPNTQDIVDPFYPDGYVSSDQDRSRIIAQKKKYAPSVGAINFKFPLKSYKAGFFQGNTTTKNAVREDIKTLLMTIKGQRVMHKNMGTNIPILAGQLFEPVNKFELTEKITMEIKNAMEIYLPFINIQNINVFTHDDDESIELNQVRVSMSYIIQDQQAMLDHMTFTVTSV